VDTGVGARSGDDNGLGCGQNKRRRNGEVRLQDEIARRRCIRTCFFFSGCHRVLHSVVVSQRPSFVGDRLAMTPFLKNPLEHELLRLLSISSPTFIKDQKQAVPMY
jgi:hypothetical protein